MNVFFMDYRYVSKDAWKYIVQVLKIKKTFCFFESSICPLNISNAIYKGENTEIIAFGDYIVLNLADEIAPHLRKPDGSISRIDKNLYLQSNSATPRHNLRLTEDPNVLVLGKVFHGGFEESYSGVDIGIYIAFHLFDLLNNQIGENSYSNRISFLLFDYITMTEYELFINRCDVYTWSRLLNSIETKDGVKKKLMTFHKMISKRLYEQFPEVFPILQINGKKAYSSFINRESKDYKKARQEWEEYCDELERGRVEEEKRQWRKEYGNSQREIDEMNRDFWKECGDAGSNCESWPGWD